MMRLARLLGLIDSEPKDQAQPLAIGTLNALLAAGSCEAGLAFASTLNEKTRALPQIRLRVARCAVAMSRFDVVIDELTAVIASGGDLPNVRHDLAHALLSDGQYERAEEVLTPVLIHSGDIADIGLLHARLLYQRRDIEAAAVIISMVNKRHPRRADAWGLAALIGKASGAEAEAEDAALRALAIEPGQPDALRARGD